MSVDWKEIEQCTNHRPWSLPGRPWIMSMSWVGLLLLHWPVEPDLVAETLPEGLTVDTWEGRAWLTVVPFEMQNTIVRGASWSPWQLEFPELNLRTYVSVDGRKRGVWFYSLDAASRIAVAGARACFNLPYYRAEMEVDQEESEGPVRYRSRRTHSGAPEGRFDCRYRPIGEMSRPAPGSFDEWLVRRYCLYSASEDGTIYRSDVHHRPWRLQDVEIELRANTLGRGEGFEMEGAPEAKHYGGRLDVLGWWPERVTTGIVDTAASIR